MVGNLVAWTGASGETYEFALHGLPCRADLRGDGNYIFTRNDGRAWQAIYIGQGDLAERVAAGEADACINQKATSHVFVRNTPGGETVRKAVEADLLARHTEAYAPTGCNKKPGG